MPKFAYQSVLHLLFFLTLASCQWSGTSLDDYLLGKPIVVPAAEGDYHYTMIEGDTVVEASARVPSFAKIGVTVLNGMFVFSGIDERFYLSIQKGTNGKRCFPFYGTNVVHKCDDEYFLMNADFIDLRKTIFKSTDNIDAVCGTQKHGFANGVTVRHNFLVQFGDRRVLMAYKRGANFNKCIGTYDIEDDQFSCMMPDINNNHKLTAFRKDGFLFDPITGQSRVADNTVEVFCKQKHAQAV